jgi:hypothetical protein
MKRAVDSLPDGLLRTAMEHQSLDALREEFAFGKERCDRVVSTVFQRLGPLSPFQ